MGTKSNVSSIVVTPALEPRCQFGHSTGEGGSFSFSTSDQSTKYIYGAGPYLSAFYDLHLSLKHSALDYGEYDTDVGHDDPAGCPSLGLILGRSDENSTVHENVTALVCFQKIAKIGLQVTYSQQRAQEPKMNTSVTPSYTKRPVRYMTNGSSGDDAFPYRPETYIGYDRNLTGFGEKLGSLDGFFVHVVNGPNGTALNDLVGKANHQHLLDAVQTLYSKYMSLVIDAKFRVPLTNQDEGHSIVHGTVPVVVTKVQMDCESKLVLQILLGCVSLFGVLAYILTDLGTTLPRKPTSVASAMAFLAGSELCELCKGTVPTDAGCVQSGDLGKDLEGRVIKLGWWSNGYIREAKYERQGVDRMHDGSAEARDGTIRVKRFGIDVGMPDQLGFRERRWLSARRWYHNLGKGSPSPCSL